MQPVVATTSGRVEGRDERGIAVFRGIPYAAPPVGSLRFAPPAPPDAWDGVRPATRFGPIAPQTVLPGVLGELFAPSAPLVQGDDCLTLNVWSPGVGGARLPVFVWMHGGGFSVGSGADPAYDGSTFARDGLVCVTLNYRLGAAGFLHVPGEGAGTFGLLDQLAALQWVQDNIAAFGGDPGQVTIAGESAGAISVGLLLGAVGAKGLFRRAIAQSGAAHHGLPVESARRIADELCTRLGVPTDDLEALRQVSSAALLAAQHALSEEVVASHDVERFGLDVVSTAMAFQPVLGTYLLPGRGIDAVATGAAADVDLLVGYTQDELKLVFALDPGLLGTAPGEEDLILDAVFDMTFPGRGIEARRTYEKSRPGATASDLLAAVETDRMFRIPAIRLLDAHAPGSGATHAYRFSWPSPVRGGSLGACHGLDVPFVWQTLDDPVMRRIAGDDPPIELADAMHAAWVGFVATGDPGTPARPWPRYDRQARAVMDFGAAVQVVREPDEQEVALWDGLLERA